MADDPFAHLRSLALLGIPVSAAPAALPRKRARSVPGPPSTPTSAVVSAREELPRVLLDEAARVWKLHAQPWTPSLEALCESPWLHLRVDGARVEVALKNATHRTRPMPSPWIAVIVAALTGRELPAVRKLLRAGQPLTRETPSP